MLHLIFRLADDMNTDDGDDDFRYESVERNRDMTMNKRFVQRILFLLILPQYDLMLLMESPVNFPVHCPLTHPLIISFAQPIHQTSS